MLEIDIYFYNFVVNKLGLNLKTLRADADEFSTNGALFALLQNAANSKWKLSESEAVFKDRSNFDESLRKLVSQSSN